MATANGRKATGLSGQLAREPQRFDFFQAVRVLEWLARREGRAARHAVGQDRAPDQEVARFRTVPSLSFPVSAISQVRLPQADLPPEITVTFLGLIGANGVLPYHYTALLLRRLRLKDASLRDFLDLFHHRLVAHFFRAWEKYRLPFAYERARVDSGGDDSDTATRGLYCFVGLGTDGLRRRLAIDDEAFLFFAGHFAHEPRSAIALESILAEYFGLPIEVLQAQGQWLYLDIADQATMPSTVFPDGQNNQLGLNLVVGERIWDIKSKFRVRVGPLTYAQFRRFMPNGDGLLPLCQLTRRFVGPEFDFDVQPILQGPEVPWCQLGSDEADGAYLGWNTWARSEPFTSDVTGPVFAIEEGERNC